MFEAWCTEQGKPADEPFRTLVIDSLTTMNDRAWTTSTSSTATGSTRRPRWGRRWARSTRRCDRARVEGGLLDALEEVGAGAICFSPLDQGRLTDRDLDGVPADSRAAVGRFLTEQSLSDQVMHKVRALGKIAEGRGQTLARLALAWTLRD